MTDEKRLCTGNIVGDYTKNKYLYDEAVVQANKLNLTEEVFHLKALSIIINDIVIKTLARIGIDLLAQKTGLVSNCHKIIGCFILSNEPRIMTKISKTFWIRVTSSMLNSISISVKSDGDHKSRISLSIIVNSIDLYTLIARIGFKRVLVKLSNRSGIVSMRFFLIIVTIAKDSVINTFKCRKLCNWYKNNRSPSLIKIMHSTFINPIFISVNSDRDHKRIHISARIGCECIDILTFYESKLQIGSLNQEIVGIGNLVIFVTLAVILKSGDPVILTLSNIIISSYVISKQTNWHHFEDLYFVTISSYVIYYQFWCESVRLKGPSSINIVSTAIIADSLMYGDADNSSLISVNSDRIHKRLAQSPSNIELQFADRCDECPDLLWSSSRNANEVNYAFQQSKDDKSKDLFGRPFVWPVIHLVLIMNQMMTGPGI